VEWRGDRRIRCAPDGVEDRDFEILVLLVEQLCEEHVDAVCP
jgi:hypothetical protein